MCKPTYATLFFTIVILSLLFSVVQAGDPTKPGSYRSSDLVNRQPNQIKRLVLNGIIHSSYRKIAIINQKPIALGQKVKGVKLLSVDKNSVMIMKNGKKQRLQLPVANIKKEIENGKFRFSK